jgi:hypothetical protein
MAHSQGVVMRWFVCLTAMMLCWLPGLDANGAPGLVLPEVSAGTLPYRSFSGDLCETPTELLTVPEGQDFLVTMVVTSTDGHTSRYGDWSDHHGAMLLQDGVIRLSGHAIGRKSTLPVASGTGRLSVTSGSTLSIKAVEAGSCYSFYLQGYFIAEGSPYRSFFGNSALGRDVLTVASGKQFLVRTIALSSRESIGHCHVWIDGVRTIHGDTWATADRNYWGSGRAGGFADGKGSMVLTEGMTLQVGPDDASVESQCDYYVAGEYIIP